MAFTRQTYFLPTQISNCSLWLDGADSSQMTFSSGNNMSTWQDKSGQGKTMTAVGSPVFQGGVNGILLNGTSQYFSNATPVLTNTYTIFFVYNKTSTTTGNLYSCYNSSANTGGNTGFFPTEGANYYLVRSDTSWASAASTIPNNNNNIVSVQYENNIVGGPISVFYNGSANISSTQTGTITYLNFTIGYRSYGSGPFLEYTQGYFYEVVAYSIVLTAPQRQQVESYLAQKWGLTGSLPAGHPGLNKIIHRNLQTTFTKKQYFTAFSPRQIPGCILWLDAADASSVTTSGTTVTAIRDKSVRATVLTSPAGFTYPNNIFNGSYPSFYNTSASGGRLGYNTTYSLGSQNTVFIVGQLTSPSVGNQFFDFIDGYTSSSRFFLFSSPNFLNNYVYGTNGSSSGQVNGAITTAQMTSPFCWSVAFDTSTTISSTLQYVNGTQLVQSPSTLGAAISSYTGIIIGQRFTQSSESVVGHICEFIIFNNVLTATQRQQVESYLAQKWGLVSSLPTTGHLHNTFPAGSPTAIQPYVASVSPLNLKFIAYPTGTPTVNTPTNTTTTLNMTWNAPTFTTSWSARQITRVIITSYTVYVLADGSLAATLSPGNVLSTTYSPMTSGVAYSYFVRANGPAGQSASSAISSTVTYILPPGSPTVNTPTNTVSTLNMTWNAPVGGGQVTSYTVYVLAAGSLVSTLTPGFVTSTTFSPMTGDVAYSFYVTATGPGGTSSASSTSATVTYSAGPMSYITGVNTYTGTTSTNWTNNWQPYLSAVFSCNAVSNITITFSKITITPAFTAGGWFLGAVHTNSNIYYPPYNATNGILCLNPNTGVTSLVGVNSGISYAGTAKWYTGCLGPDGNIYFFPTLKATILKYIPSTDTASEITIAGTGGTYASQGYRGAVLGSDGRIYSSPYGATSIFWYNPATNTSGNIASASSTANRYEGAAIGTNGNIYFSPLTAQLPILKLNLSTYATTTTITTGVSATNNYRGAASLAANGNLYFPPSSTNSPVISMTSAESVSLLSVTSATGYRDTFLGPDGNIYVIPAGNAINVVKVVTSNNSISVIANTQTPTTQFNSQGANMALDGNIYVSVNGANVILKIIFNNVRYPFDSNYILSPYASHH